MSEPVRIHTPEYYNRLKAIEGRHWWTLGMTDVMTTVLHGQLPSGPSQFLDIGCGSGIGLAWAARRLPESRRIGVDLSIDGLAHCRGLGAELVVGSAEALPTVAGSIDLAICLDVLQHVEHDSAAAREAARVLKPGGLLFARTNALGLAAAPPGSRLYTRDRLVKLVTDSGLEIVHASRVNCVGGVAAEAARFLRRVRRGGNHRHGSAAHTAHGLPTESQSAHRSYGESEAKFEGGGYGTGLTLAPEAHSTLASRCKQALLRSEGLWIRSIGRLPFGHSLIVLARKP